MRQSAADNFESEALRSWTSEDKEQVASDLLNVLHRYVPYLASSLPDINEFALQYTHPVNCHQRTVARSQS